MRTGQVQRIPSRGADVPRARYGCWRDAGGLALLLAVAAALWVAVLAAVADPLGATLAKIDADRGAAVAQAPCPTPPGALALATPPAEPCR